MTIFCMTSLWVLTTPQKPTGLYWLVIMRLMCWEWNCQISVHKFSTLWTIMHLDPYLAGKVKVYSVTSGNFLLCASYINMQWSCKCTFILHGELVGACHLAIHGKQFNWIGWIYYGANVGIVYINFVQYG